MATNNTRRGQTLNEAYDERRRTADRAQREARRRQLFDQLQLMRADLLKGGVLAGALPVFNQTSSDADLAGAVVAMERLKPKTVSDSGKTDAPSTGSSGRDTARLFNPPTSETAAEMERRTEAGTLGALDEQTRFADANPGATSAQIDSFLGGGSKPVPTSGDRVPPMLAAMRASGTLGAGANLRRTGAGFETEVELADGRKRWVGVAPTLDETMSARTGGTWAALPAAGRAAELRKVPLSGRHSGEIIGGGPTPVFTDSLGRTTDASGARRDSTFMGLDMGDGPSRIGPGGKIVSAPGTIVGGAGVTPITGGSTLNVQDTAGNVVGRHAQGRYGSGTSTFAALPPAPRPAQGSQVAPTTGVNAAAPASAPSTANTNLTGPASSTGEAYQQAPRPPVPQPATSPIAANAAAPGVAKPQPTPFTPPPQMTTTQVNRPTAPLGKDYAEEALRKVGRGVKGMFTGWADYQF